jgi:hypothetical protein
MNRSTLHPLLTVLMLVAVGPAHAAAQTVVVQGENDDRPNRPIDMTFTKWITTFPLMEGYWGGDLANEFVGEVFQRQVSQRQADNCYLPAPNCGRIIRLEALYEFHNGDRSFTALIRGGTSGDSGAALLDGTILFGWRVGAPVHAEFQTIPGATGCFGAPPGATCFQGTIRVGRAPRD